MDSDTKLRQRISRAYNQEAWDEIARIPRVSLIDPSNPRRDLRKKNFCYAGLGFPESDLLEVERGEAPKGFSFTDSPGEGDFAVYLKQGQFTHVGKVAEENQVLSKWREGPWFHHPLWHVPMSFGNKVVYLKKAKE